MEAAYPGIDRIIDGHYVRSFMVDGICYHTRSGVLWRSLLGRVKENGCEQRHRNTYAGCSNNFEDFNSFSTYIKDHKPANSLLLIKGSRGMALEKTLEII